MSKAISTNMQRAERAIALAQEITALQQASGGTLIKPSYAHFVVQMQLSLLRRMKRGEFNEPTVKA